MNGPISYSVSPWQAIGPSLMYANKAGAYPREVLIQIMAYWTKPRLSFQLYVKAYMYAQQKTHYNKKA